MMMMVAVVVVVFSDDQNFQVNAAYPRYSLVAMKKTNTMLVADRMTSIIDLFIQKIRELLQVVVL